MLSKKDMTDEDFAQYFDSLCSLADSDCLSTISVSERTIILVWWAKALVDNGGFEYFYEGACNAGDVAKAFFEVGLDSIANAFLTSVRVFPNKNPIPDHELRQQWLSQREVIVKRAFARPNKIVWSVDEKEVLNALKAYVVAHENSFR